MSQAPIETPSSRPSPPEEAGHGPASRLMPAEWEPHEATWIAWPHHEPDWPGKLEAVRWVFAEVVRVLHARERVEILCRDHSIMQDAAGCLEVNGVPRHGYRLHMAPTDRAWVRDSGGIAVRQLPVANDRSPVTGGPPPPPAAVDRSSGPRATGAWQLATGNLEWIRFRFNAWAKYDNYLQDEHVPAFMAEATGMPMVEALTDDGRPAVLEGGAIDTDGAGTLLTSEECLLSDVQCRNPGLGRDDYERLFARYLGIRHTIWLGGGCAGDDTHGHVDDIARFVAPATVALAYEPDPADVNHAASADNLRRLEKAHDVRGRPLRIVKLPMPRPVIFDGQRLPASYANFYIANGVVMVPTFNDANDRVALNILADFFPDRRVIGIHALDLVWGFGTLHCMTQQQPAEAVNGM